MAAAMRGVATAAALAWLWAGPALAQADGPSPGAPRAGWMSGAAIQTEFSGRRLSGIYPNTNPWSEQIHADGSTDYREGDRHWLGRWWVDNDAFCFVYPPPGVGGCFRVVRLGVNCYELYDFSRGAGAAPAPPDLANLWNGRMWDTGRPATCDEKPTS